jgi:hypothetical protein
VEGKNQHHHENNRSQLLLLPAASNVASSCLMNKVAPAARKSCFSVARSRRRAPRARVVQGAMAAATANHEHDKRKTHIKKAGLSASVKAGAAQAN